MRSETGRRRLVDIRDNILRAQRFIEHLNLETFEQSELHVFGVTRCLEIISEASRRLSDELKARHPEIPWRDIAGAGNIYRHEYERVRIDLVWGTVVKRLPALFEAIVQELERADRDEA